MRHGGVALAATIIVLALLGSTGAPLPATSPAPHPGAPTAASDAHFALAPSVPPVALPLTAWNTTIARPSPFVGPPPTSALIETPAPRPPPTTPTVLSLLSSSTSCCVDENLTAPVGTWAMIVLNYTGVAVNGVYDSSYRAYVGHALVLLGTTPEYGTWTVLQDLTAYSALMRGTFNFTFLLGAAVTNGYFLTSVSLSFYPVPAGGAAPPEPDTIIPLWYRSVVTPSSPTVYANVTLPSNVTNATLELFCYGFGGDEFWYDGSPPYRVLQVASNGSEFASVLPFPYINTGGIDLFTWRPITAAFTLDDRPYDLNVTAALGMLEGNRNLTARLSGISGGSDWVIGGALLLDTSPSAGPATLTTYSISTPAPSLRTGSNFYDESATVSYQYSSVVGLPAGQANVSLSTSEGFWSNSTTGGTWLGASWANLTANEETVATTVTTTASGASEERQVVTFPLSMDIGNAFVETSSNNGSYPIYGNFTMYFDGVSQEWNEVRNRSGADPASTLLDVVDNHLTAPVNVYAGQEERTSPNAALILATTFIQSQTTKLYQQDRSGGGGGGRYSHLLAGSAYQPSNAFQAETVEEDVVSNPLTVFLAPLAPVTDVGVGLNLTVTASGGGPPLTVSWSGLPPGCTSSNTQRLACIPSAPGTFVVTATVTDSLGDVAPPVFSVVQVHPPPSVVISGNRSGADVGVPVLFVATAVGGTGTLVCSWLVNGAGSGVGGSCTAPFILQPTASGTFAVSARVVDSLGLSATTSTPVSITVADPPTVALSLSVPNLVSVGHPIVLTAEVTGGTGVLVYEWTLNSTTIPGATGSSYQFVPIAPGNYTFAVSVVDGGGGAASSGGIGVMVTPGALPPPTGGNSSTTEGSSNGGLGWYVYLAIGIAVGVVVGLLLSTLATPPKRRPPSGRVTRRPAARPSPPTPGGGGDADSGG